METASSREKALAMTSLAIEPSTEWRWSEVAAQRRTYTLRSPTNLLGGLRFEGGGSLATADSAGHRWTFKRVGFFNPRITVRRPNATVDDAVFTPTWTGGGTLHLPGGTTFEWRSLGLWSFEHGWFSSSGGEVLRVRPSTQSKVEADVVVAGRDTSQLELLSLLSFYLLLLAAEDLSDASVVAVSSST